MQDDQLQAWLRENTRFGRLVHVECCESTQALAATAEPAESAVIWADHQNAGRGRQGRSWNDTPGQDLALTFRVTGLMLQNPTHLAALAPVAILRALEPALDHELTIKWPNDVLFGGRKLSGVLIDSHGRDNATHLIGIGINVNRSSFPGELQDTATSLALLTGRESSRHEIARDLAASLEAAMKDLEALTLGRWVELFRDRLGLMGRDVEAVAAAGTHTGKLEELDFDHLRLGDTSIALAHVQQLRLAR